LISTLINKSKQKEMKKIIHYAFILDQSGSMEPIKKEVVASFNEQVEAVKKLKRKNPDSTIKFTLCVFNDEIEFRFISQDIAEINKIGPGEYQPNSCTALYDAIGLTYMKTRKHIKSNDQVFFVIFTDGLENASTDYKAEDIQKFLARASEKRWQVKFFCGDEDNLFYKQQLGFSDSQVMPVSLNEAGLKTMETEICYCLSQMVNTPKN
jgi:hypothetical protein